jgi:uncharacterized protein with HEPN domain
LKSSARLWPSSPSAILSSRRGSAHRRIIAFRNILVHGYADVDDQLVWDIAESKLAALRTEVAALLREP